MEKKKLSLPAQIFIALLLGIVVGLAFYFMGKPEITTNYLKPFGTIFLNLIQFIVVAVESSAAALIFETPTLAEYGANFLPVVYCGVMSSGAGYTLQILGQKDLNPAIASLIMCLESVFSALGGWLLLGQNLSMRESAGCTLIFAAVVLSQLPLAELHRCKKGA